MLFVISVALSLIIIVFAVFAVLTKCLPSAAIASSAVSLFASVLYVIYAAPDVALTEAVIGSGLMTVIFFIVLSRLREGP